MYFRRQKMILDLMQAITLMQGTTQAAGQTKAGSTSYIVLMVVLGRNVFYDDSSAKEASKGRTGNAFFT